MQHTVSHLGDEAFAFVLDGNRENAVRFATRDEWFAFVIPCETGYDVFLLDPDAPAKDFKTYDYPQLSA